MKKFFKLNHNGSDLSKKNDSVMKMNERVIYLWSIPATGHLNPTLCLTNQLLSQLDAMNVSRIIFYSNESFRERIINLPNNIDKKLIEFRDYGLKDHLESDNVLKQLMDFECKPGELFRIFRPFMNGLDLGTKYLGENLLADMYKEKPVLVLYDQVLFFPKIIFHLYSKRFKCPKPLSICYVTTFMCARSNTCLFDF
jgi:hypothetical protein